MHLGHSLHKL
jgi:multisite-specific tRNA:(cytosine-C5)-methyltransferase